MTPQEVIKTFMSSLVNHDSSITTGTAMLDDAVKSSSRFLGVQNVIDNIKADQTQAERDAVEEILGSDYAGKTMSEVGNTILNADAKNYSSTKISNAYVSDRQDKRTTVRRVILERKAYIFLEKYCGIQLPEKYWLYSDNDQSYWADENGATGNVDTGAITGSDANITLTAGDVVYNTTMTSALFNNYAKQDGISLSSGNLIVGTGVEKTASSVVPEIGNKYTATASAGQNITTGSHDWIVVATDKNDTVTTGGADSIDAGAGNDKITVGASYASILTGEGNDTVEVGADVNNITFDDLSATDNVTIKGTFNVGSSQTDGTTLIVTDKTGNRKIYFGNYANSADAKINGKTLSSWLGIDLNNVSSESVTESAYVEEPVAQAAQAAQTAGQLDGETHFPPASDENASTDTTQKLSKLNLDDVTLLKGDIYVGSSKVGEISSDFPNVSSFTKNGLTVNLYGVASDTSGSDKNTKTVMLDQLTADQKTVLAGLFKWWAKECTQINEDSYGVGFNSATAAVKEIDLVFYDSKGSGNTLASVGYTSFDGKATRLTLKVNMNYYKGMSSDDADGTGSNTTSLFDRTLAHEMTHAIMASNITNFSNLPQFITEGTAELTHGIDDTRSNTIFGLAYNATDFAKALDLKNTSTGNVNSYAGGYMFLRYLAKQGSLQTLTNYANPDAGASWSISGTTATYTVDGQPVATLSGLAKGLAVKGTEIEGISVSGNVITLSKAVLGTTKVSLGKNDNFTLALGSDLGDNKVTVSNKLWSVSGNTATLKADYSTGYMITDEGKSVTYQSAKQGQTIATVTGLATTGVSSTDFPTNDTVITLKKSMLGEKTVKITKGDGYTLAFADDAPKPAAQAPAWNLNNTTAIYAQETSAGFTLSDDAKTANYSAVTATQLAKVTGIKKITDDNKAAIANAINVSGNVISLGADALATSNVKVTGDYTLALASGAPTPTAQAPAWELKDTKATYKQGTSAGFTASDDAKTLKYNAESSETLATVTGIKKVTEDNKAAIAAAINISGTTVTLGKDALATSNVKVTGEGYTLALASNAPTAAVETTLWEVKGTKATYKKVKTGYFTKKDDTNLTYNKEVVADTYATISGIRKDASTDSISLSGNVITLSADALDENPTANTKITLGKNDEYTLKLDKGIAAVAYDAPAFTFNKTTATLGQKAKTAGYSTSSDGKTITYVPENTTESLATVTGIVNVTSANQAAVTKALTVSGTKISVGKDALTTSNVTVKGGDYTLALASEALKPLTKTPTWDIKGTSATYKQEQGTGYTLAADSKSIKYSGETTATLATVSGITKVDDTNKDAVAKAITVNDTVITLGAAALGASKVTVKGDNYTLKLANDSLKPTEQAPDWKFKNTTATYVKETSAGFTPSTDNKTLNYSGTTSKTLATVSGIVKVTDDNQVAVKAALSVNDKVITVGKAALGTSKITLGNKDEYTLVLADAPTASTETNVWEVKGNKATYKTVNTGYFTKQDDKTYNYTAEKAVKTLATVTGLRKDAALDSFSLSGNVITLTADALDEAPTAKTKITLGKNDEYTLKLADGIANVAYNPAEFAFNKTTATLAATVKTAGYSTSADGKTITYVDEKDAKGKATSQTLATVSGLVKVTDDNQDAIKAAVTYSGNVITLGKDALGTSKVTVKGDYTLALANDSLKPTLQDPAWTLKGTAATYAQATSDGFTPSIDNKILNYNKATSTTLATVNGIAKVTADNQDTIKAAITLSDNVITLGKDALGTSKVTVKGDDYTLALASEELKPTLQDPAWSFKGTNATYAQETSAGFTPSEDSKTLVYSKATSKTLATVSGLTKVTNDNLSAVTAAVSIKDNVITLGKDALTTSKVAVRGEGYTLTLANDVPIETTSVNVWQVSGNKATYKTISTGYFDKQNDTAYNYVKDKATATLATVTGLRKNAALDSFSLSGNVITLTADALDEAPTSKTKITLGNKDEYTLKLADGIANVAYNPAEFAFNKTTATLAATVKTAGYSASTDGKTITYIADKDAKGNPTSTTLATVSGIAKVDETADADAAAKIKAAVTFKDNVITLGKDALATSKVTVKGDYTLAIADSLKPTLQSPDWVLKNTTATYAQETSAGFTPSTDGKALAYSKAASKTLATVSGITKVTADNYSTVKAALSIDGKVVTVAKAALGTSNISVKDAVKNDGYTLKLANDAPTATAESTLWEVSGNKAVYKTVNTGFFTQKDDTAYTYTKEKILTTHATVTGLRKNAALDSFSLSGNVITLTANALDETPTAKTKVTLGKKDAYTLALGTGLNNVTYNDPTWAYNNNKATYIATVKTAGFANSADSKTITYIPTTDAKGNAVSTTLATLSGVKSAEGISVSGNVISLGADALNEKKVTLGKNDDFTLKLADSSLAPVAESNETWLKSGSKATLSVTMSKGYILSDDAKTLNYANKSSDKILAQITGINKDVFINTFDAVQDGDTKVVNLKALQLTNKVTLAGEYKFAFASDYKDAAITGSATADNISVAGTGLSVTGGKGDDYVSLGGSDNVFIYANGDGNDTIADFTAANDKLKVTNGTPEVSTSGSDAVITIGTGSITLKDAASSVNDIVIVDKNDAQIYPAASAALLEDNHFAQAELDDITPVTIADNSLGDLDLNRDATALDTPTVTFSGDDDK